MLMPAVFVLTTIVVSLIPILLFVGLSLWKRNMRPRRSPLTTELHHLPGQYVRSQAERLSEAANDRVALLTTLGPIVLAVWALGKIDLAHIHLGWQEAMLFLTIVVIATWGAWSAVKLMEKRRQYLDGLAAERATAQALAPLTGKGCAIYHDVPGEHFNLDHIVIGRGRIYVVETKSRRKPGASGKANSEVTFDGKALHFPGWRETQALDQARAERHWLSEYLYRKTGERSAVEAVIAIPGWYVKCKVPTADVHVINPRAHAFMAVTEGTAIPEAQRRRIMTAIEERYRVTGNSVEPTGQYG